MLLALVAAPWASADDLHHRKHRVQGRIDHTLVDLDQSSSQLVAATKALHAAQAKLSAARAHLARTRGELAAAEVLDRRKQAELDAAVLQLRQARADLAAGRAKVTRQEDVLAEIAVENYQSGDPSLLGLSMVLTSHDPAELTSQLNSVHNVLDKESVSLDRLKASRVLLTVEEEKVHAAKDEVAAQRRAAARNLQRRKHLEAEAETAEERVSDLVTLRTQAHDAAARARAADLSRLRGLQKERDRISEMLRRRAQAAAAAASAAESASDGSALNSNGFLDYPVSGPITSPYGMRMHPIYHRWTLHDGTDFGVGCGTPIHAAASGRVIAMYFNAGYGNRVIMDNGYHRGVGLGTAYNHLSSYSTYVGQRVQRGDVIGYVGSTGFSTGCHLHFMVFENGATVNPMGWL
jgi:murein DD-endopeptidase MepM/ murein hydrolase activator NlpD